MHKLRNEGTGKRLKEFYSVDKGLCSGTDPSDPLAAGLFVRKMECLCASGTGKSVEVLC